MGELVRGLQVVNATRTVTGTGTAYQVGAVAQGQRLVATLHVTAASASDTLDVVIQSDDAQGMGSPTTRITFDQVTGIGAWQKELTGPITDTWYRESRTIAGSGTSFTYMVTVGVAGAAAAGIADAHLALVAALGGDSAVKALYVTTHGVTGDAADSVLTSGGVVDSWQDYRGSSGYAPAIAFAGTARPAWDAGAKLMTFDGTDDTGSTGASAVFDANGVRCLAVVGTRTAGLNYVAVVEGTGPTRWIAIDASGGTWKGEFSSSFSSISSGVAADGTRRVVIASQTAGTTGKAAVPNQAQVTGAIGSANAAGNNNLTLFKNPSAGQFSTGTLKALLFLAIDPDATQRDLIRDWAITHCGAVAA